MEMGLFYLHPKVVYIYLILRSFVILLYADTFRSYLINNSNKRFIASFVPSFVRTYLRKNVTPL